MRNGAVFVTGGSSGIGAATVLAPVKDGLRVGWCDVEKPTRNELLAAVDSQKALFVQAVSGVSRALLPRSRRRSGTSEVSVPSSPVPRFTDWVRSSR